MTEAWEESGERQVGDMLRQAREQRGLSRRDIAVELHMDMALVESLESNRFEHLGAPIFVRGHLRNYARLLGLSAEEVVAEYDRQAPSAPAIVVSRHDGPSISGGSRWVPVATLVLLVGMFALLGLWWRQHPDLLRVKSSESSADKSAQVMQVPAISTDVPAAQESHGAGQAGPSAPQGDASTVAQDNQGAATDEKPVETRQPAASTASAPAQPVAPASVSAVLDVRQDSWVEVYDAGGKRLYYDLASAGQTLRVRGVPPLQIFLGNSPGVKISVDGRSFDQSRFAKPDGTARFQLDTGSGR